MKKTRIITIIIIAVVSVTFGYLIAKLQCRKQISNYEKQIEIYNNYYNVSEVLFIDIAQHYKYWSNDKNGKFSYKREMCRLIDNFEKK
jgi:hypothetical protein